MSKESDNFATKGINVRLPGPEWLKVLITVVLVVGGNSWVMARWVSRIETQAEQTAEQVQQNIQDIKIVDERVSKVKDQVADSLLRISTDIGEIKGKLSNLPTKDRP